VHRVRPRTLVLVLPALVGTAALLAASRHGPYASPDSAFYVGLARHLVDGAGLTAPPGSPPLAHFPPLFPLLLAAAGRLGGIDPLDAAAVVNPLLFGATAVLVAMAVRSRTGSTAVAVAAGAGAVVGQDLLVYGGSALSEPLFTVLVLGSLLALARSVTQRSDLALAGAATLAAAACLTRYVGVALVLAGAAVLWRLEPGRRRWRAALFAAASSGPALVWVAAVGRANRPLELHLFDLRYWSTGIGSLSRWVLPGFVPWPLRVAALGALGAALLHLRRQVGAGPPGDEGSDRRAVQRADPLPMLLVAFAACYMAVLVGDRLVLDDTGRLDARFLAPLHVVALVGLVPFAHRALRPPTAAAYRRRAAVAVVGLAGLHGLQAVTFLASGVWDDSVDRRGLSGRAWQESPVMADLADLPDEVPVYSNAADAVFLLLGRRSASIPPRRDYLRGTEEPGYGAAVEAMGRDLRRRGGVVVYFTPFEYRQVFLPSAAQLASSVPLEVVATDALATVYRWAGRRQPAATAASAAGSQLARSASRPSLEKTSTSG